MSDESGYDLVMPFLPVQSKGGPYDDHAYVAGYEMGLLDAALHIASTLAPLLGMDNGTYSKTIHIENQAQADLIAMRYGFKASFVTEDEFPEWAVMTLSPMTDGAE